MLSRMLAGERETGGCATTETKDDSMTLAPLRSDDVDDTERDADASVVAANRQLVSALDRVVLSSSCEEKFGAKAMVSAHEMRRKASARELHGLRAELGAPEVGFGPDTALLVVDVQPVYWSENPEVVRSFPELPNNMRTLLNAARAGGAYVAHVRASYAYHTCPWLQTFERMNPGRSKYEIDPHETEPFAEPLEGEAVFHKRTFDAFYGEGCLSPELRAAGVKTVVVCGLITSVCVQHCVFGAFNAGFRVAVAHDACGDRSRARHEAALELYADYMYEAYSVQDVVRHTRKRMMEEKTLSPSPASSSWIRSAARDPVSIVRAAEVAFVADEPVPLGSSPESGSPSRFAKEAAYRASPASTLNLSAR